MGLPDLSDGVDLPANAAIQIGLDGAPPVQIGLTAADPTHLTLPDLVVLISLALGSGVASHDGHHLILASSQTGAAAQLSLETPSGEDATQALFGFPAPRRYQGADARAAQLTGGVDLSGEHDLTLARYLRIGVDGAPPVEIDCAAGDPLHTELEDIVAKINAAIKVDVASVEGNFLKLQSLTAGPSSRLVLERFLGGDARSALLGAPIDQTSGEDPTPAVITGTASLTSPPDLTQRSILRIAVDGGRARDIDVRGVAPQTTLLEEIVTAINQIFPGLASAVELDQLRLTSPTAGPDSSVEVLPLRVLEVIEYPPQPVSTEPRSVVHGDAWNLDNDGVGSASSQVRLYAPQALAGRIWSTRPSVGM